MIALLLMVPICIAIARGYRQDLDGVRGFISTESVFAACSCCVHCDFSLKMQLQPSLADSIVEASSTCVTALPVTLMYASGLCTVE